MTEHHQALATPQPRHVELSNTGRNLLTAVLGGAECPALILDANGRIVMFNRHCEQLTGFAFAELEGRYIWERLVQPHDCVAVRAEFGQLDSGDFPATRERVWLTQSGETRLIRWCNTVLWNALGQAQYVVSTGRDVTPGTEAAASANEGQLQAILDNAVEAIITIDEQGLMQSANRAAERIFGYTVDEMLGQDVGLLMSDSHREEHDQYLANYLRTGKANIIGHGREVVGRRKSGERFPLELAVSEVDLGQRRLFTGIARDISHRRRQEEAARHRLEEVAHSARLLELGEMAAGLAHEVNQPLSAISSFAEASLRLAREIDGAPPALSKALARIADQAERASRIVSQLRGFARKEQAELRPADVNAVVREALELVDHELKQDRVETSLLAADDLPTIPVDKVQLEQILLNLIRNSLEAMRVQPHDTRSLAISTRRAKSGSIEVRVADTGPGLGEDMTEQVFEMFHTSKPGGLGIGLAICRSIAESHGGALEVEQTSTAGTTMRLTLPQQETDRT